VQNYQQDQQRQAMSKANDALKDPAVRDAVFNDATLAFAGNKTGKHVVAEFFDYDCPVCKIQFKALVELIKTDPELKVVFHEFPIFGPTSDENSK
ncbi:DsbA family protein, partial [Escherichia coli]